MSEQSKIVNFTNTIIRFKWLVVLTATLLTLGMGSGLQHLQFTSDYRVWFADDNPDRVAFEKLQDTYTRNDNIMFVIQPKNGDVFNEDTLTLVKDITEQSWQIPFSIRVDSITNYQHTEANEDDLVVEDLFYEIKNISKAQLEKGKQVALTEPMLVGRLVSDDARTTAVNVTMQLPQKSEAESPAAMAKAREIAAELNEKYPNTRIALTGMVPLNVAFFEASMADMSTLTPMMYLLILVVTAFLLRSFTGTINTLIVIAFSTMAAMGFAGWIGIKLTPASAIAPTIVLTLAVADSIHILVSLLHEMRQGKNKNDALREAMRLNFHPVFLTSITTAIGFLSLNFAEAPPFHDLGNIAAVGVMGAFLYSVILLPALISILPLRVKERKESGLLTRIIDSFADFVIAYKKRIFFIMMIVVVMLAVQIPKIELNDKFIEYFDHSVQFRNDSDFAAEALAGTYNLDYSLESGEKHGMNNPEFLQVVDKFTAWLRTQPEVDHVFSIADTMKRLNMSMNGDDKSFYKLPDNKELAAQYMLMYQMSLPYGLDLNNQIDINESATRISVTAKNLSTREFRTLAVRTNKWLDDNLKGKFRSDGAVGPTLMFSFISERNINGMLIGTSLSLVLISLLLIWALKDFKHGIVSLIPNIIPAALAFGIWALTWNQIGMGVSMVIAMSLGVIVDDTVHFLSKYLRAIKEKNMSSEEAVRYAFHTAGKALLVTSIVIVAGFFVLSTSPFKVNSHMGLLNAIIISMAVFADFLLLPTVLMLISKTKKGSNSVKSITPVALALLCIIPFAANAKTADEISAQNTTPETLGKAVADEVEARFLGYKDLTANMEMTLYNAAGDNSKRVMRMKTIENPDITDGDKSLIVFDVPRDIRGTALLSYPHFSKPDDQWIYFPKIGKEKRISSRNKSGPFMGSEFAYEDVSFQEMYKYTYKHINDEACGELQCYKLHRFPTYESSGYTKQVLWIDKDEFRIQKIEFYDRKDSLLKTMELKDYRQYLGKFWRTHDMFITNHQTRKSTSFITTEIEFQSGLAEKNFTKAALKRAK
jgi:predicted RND superfamily exporter protein/outer membrane lipoprotein-sorting protein